MNRYLFKVNGEQHCPNGICRPRFASEWEGGEILIPAGNPFYVARNQVKRPVAVHDDDEVWIWTHEHEKSGRGWGLTSKAYAGRRREHGNFFAITLKHVELLAHPFGFRYLGEGETGSFLLDYMRNHRSGEVYFLDDTEYFDFLRIVNRCGFSLSTKVYSFDDNDLGINVLKNGDEIVKALTERRLSCRKVRPDQAHFRSSLLHRYDGRCVLTGCSVPEALEAAHVLPHNGDPLRDTVENGLLLRRDLHSMFDAMLWSIDPDTHKVHFSPSVNDQPYVRLNGSTINHKVASEPLLFHFIEFRKANSDA